MHAEGEIEMTSQVACLVQTRQSREQGWKPSEKSGC